MKIYDKKKLIKKNNTHDFKRYKISKSKYI